MPTCIVLAAIGRTYLFCSSHTGMGTSPDRFGWPWTKTERGSENGPLNGYGGRRMTQRIGIDIGGTFTDLVAVTADGRVLTHKVASTPSDFGDAIIDGLTELLASHGDTVIDVLHGT